jgi:PAS domain S-box-containing protein
MSRLHPEDEKRVLEQYYVLIGKGSSIFSCEYRFRRKDGGYAYVLDRGHIIRNAAGKAVRMIGGMTDLTERRRAEERIAEQAALIDKAQDAILVRDLEHRVTYWNQSAERIFGWNAEEVIDLSARELFYADPASFDQAMSELLERGDWTGELSMLTKDEHKITVESRWTLVHDAEGRPRSVLVINTDCTDRKKIEQQFLRAQRMESIGTLAGGIAHDLNNVLGPIIMALDLLRMRFPDQASQDLLAVVGNSARHGADMVSQVLSFARGVEGRRMEVQIKHLVSGVEKIANDTFLKHVLVQTIVPPDLWTVLGDPTQLHQVLLNLCVNARDAMPDGGTLTISAENLLLDAHYAGLNPEAQPGPYIALHVEDTGTGMPPDVIQKIFDPFFTTKELGKGTGLGLSSSMAIVKSHRGFLRVYSEPGNGTKFIVYLPAETEISQAAAVVLEAEIPRGEGELILVVDDEDSVRQITRQTLEAFGYRVILACDGVEAVEIYTAQAAEIAAVLTDMMMPIMDGPATIHVLRKMNPAAKIICASGLAANSQLAESASLGVKHFLPKPYSAETLLKILRQILTGDQ